MHWDWDWHMLHHHRPWYGDAYWWRSKCPVRAGYWPSALDYDWDLRPYDCGGYAAPEWCHHTCLTERVYVESGDEEDTSGKGSFKVIMDVRHFKATELRLRAKNTDTLIVEGKMGADRTSKSPALCIATQFTRKYRLPRHYDATLAKATLSKDGILTILVPAPPPLDDVERDIEIQQTESYFGSREDNSNKALEDSPPAKEAEQEPK